MYFCTIISDEKKRIYTLTTDLALESDRGGRGKGMGIYGRPPCRWLQKKKR